MSHHHPLLRLSFMVAQVLSRRRVSVFIGTLLIGTTLAAAAPTLVLTAAPTMTTAPTLATTAQLPGDDIESLLLPGQWKQLSQAPYQRYILMDAIIDAQGRVQICHVAQSYPDHRLDRVGQGLAREVNLWIPTAGSYLPRRAQICVIFYPEVPEGRQVLIFARQTGDSPIGMFGKAMYLHSGILRYDQ